MYSYLSIIQTGWDLLVERYQTNIGKDESYCSQNESTSRDTFTIIIIATMSRIVMTAPHCDNGLKCKCVALFSGSTQVAVVLEYKIVHGYLR